MTTTTNRQKLVIGTLSDIRNDIKFYNKTGIIPSYVESIIELKYVENRWSEKAYNLRYEIDTKKA